MNIAKKDIEDALINLPENFTYHKGKLLEREKIDLFYRKHKISVSCNHKDGKIRIYSQFGVVKCSTKQCVIDEIYCIIRKIDEVYPQ